LERLIQAGWDKGEIVWRAQSKLKIKTALPNLFSRPYMMLEPSTKTHFALSLLGFHEIDAITIWFGKNADWTRRFVVYGYSAILTLLRSDPKDYAMMLEQPCETVAVEPASISGEDDLGSLLDLFLKRRFGFAYVEKARGTQIGGFVNLRDLVKLYESSIFKTDLLVGDVASYPVVSMSGDTDLKSVLDYMVRKNVRRILVSDTQKTISDREIISHITETFRFGVKQDLSHLLNARLGDLKSTQPRTVELELPISQAARIVYDDGGCLLCGEGIITPWDLIIKPWIQKKLSIS
jgi:CBS domain-containing protein